jgi:hypothetical protein
MRVNHHARSGGRTEKIETKAPVGHYKKQAPGWPKQHLGRPQKANQIGRVFYHMAGDEGIILSMQVSRNRFMEWTIGPDVIHLLDPGRIDAGMIKVLRHQFLTRRVIQDMDQLRAALWEERVIARPNL